MGAYRSRRKALKNARAREEDPQGFYDKKRAKILPRMQVRPIPAHSSKLKASKPGYIAVKKGVDLFRKKSVLTLEEVKRKGYTIMERGENSDFLLQDADGRVVAVRISPPKDWAPVIAEAELAAELLAQEWDGPLPGRQVRRGPFRSAHSGFSYGGGQKVSSLVSPPK
ncbi:hypothetical protein BOTBODRAFT_288362 [Botryobasidium botryosum FD-172 SS1]|uniref:Uncharacterized protein n=1 Tax=Botryobasidium botryosum (strain FD-172 SS1) TaxID=930990 RepID=A0A067M2T3_BOTB1|nr:hypothetical protein BOTBODRAFT_288362 [Botryobasidium botryosum FD-172 SS1]